MVEAVGDAAVAVAPSVVVVGGDHVRRRSPDRRDRGLVLGLASSLEVDVRDVQAVLIDLDVAAEAAGCTLPAPAGAKLAADRPANSWTDAVGRGVGCAVRAVWSSTSFATAGDEVRADRLPAHVASNSPETSRLWILFRCLTLSACPAPAGDALAVGLETRRQHPRRQRGKDDMTLTPDEHPLIGETHGAYPARATTRNPGPRCHGCPRYPQA